jgi:hypothetical protein
MTDARLYAKIMRHLETTTGTGHWDWPTINLTHPQLAAHLYRMLLAVIPAHTIAGGDRRPMASNYYLPRRLWAWEREIA